MFVAWKGNLKCVTIDIKYVYYYYYCTKFNNLEHIGFLLVEAAKVRPSLAINAFRSIPNYHPVDDEHVIFSRYANDMLHVVLKLWQCFAIDFVNVHSWKLSHVLRTSWSTTWLAWVGWYFSERLISSLSSFHAPKTSITLEWETERNGLSCKFRH